GEERRDDRHPVFGEDGHALAGREPGGEQVGGQAVGRRGDLRVRNLHPVRQDESWGDGCRGRLPPETLEGRGEAHRQLAAGRSKASRRMPKVSTTIKRSLSNGRLSRKPSLR